MDLTSLTCVDFTKALASGDPTPGGGSVAALSGSFGAALIAMVCNVTVGKEKYKEHEALLQEILQEAESLRQKLLDEVLDDVAAFQEVSAAYKMPRDTVQEKRKRVEKVQVALKEATLAPFAVITISLSALEVCGKAVNKSNVNAVSDLAVAALCLKTAVSGAYLNILSNLGAIRDIDFASKYLLKAQELVNKATGLADQIYNGIAADLTHTVETKQAE